MDYVGPGLGNPLCDVSRRGHVHDADLARHHGARQAERKFGNDLVENPGGKRPAGIGVTNDAYLMPARCLSAHDVDDVAEQPAHWRAQDVQNSKTSIRPVHPGVAHDKLIRINGCYG
jgi:hypothetical protein